MAVFIVTLALQSGGFIQDIKSYKYFIIPKCYFNSVYIEAVITGKLNLETWQRIISPCELLHESYGLINIFQVILRDSTNHMAHSTILT